MDGKIIYTVFLHDYRSVCKISTGMTFALREGRMI